MKRALLAVTMVCFAMINATAATWHVPTLIMPAAIEIKSIKEISPYLASGDTVEVRTTDDFRSYAGEGGTIIVDKSVIIKGMDGVIIRPAGVGFPTGSDVFNIVVGGNLTIQTLSMSGKDGGNVQRVGAMINVGVGSATITSSAITGCATGLKQSGGAITANSCRIVGNTVAVNKTAGTTNIDNCWWGLHNLSMSGLFTGVTIPTKFLVLEGSVSPTTINVGGTATVSVTLRRNNLGEVVGQLPDGVSVLFTQTPVRGTCPTVTTVGTIASSTFTATSAGSTLLSITADNQTINAGTVTINAVSAVTDWANY